MRTRLMIAAAATATLLAGAALAQAPAASGSNFKQSADTAVNPPAADTAPYTAPVDSTTVAPAAGAPTERAPAATAGTDLVTNGPVPDTRENRAKYGMPMSNAGRHTKAAGN